MSIFGRVGLTVDEELAASGLVKAEKGADGGGFAGAVAAEEAEDLAFFNGEIEVFYNSAGAKGHGEVLDGDEVFHRVIIS